MCLRTNSSAGTTETNSAAAIETNSAAVAIEINIVNRSAAIIHEIYVAPEEDTDWGDDRLGENALEADESVAINVIAGNYNVQLVDDKDRECEIEGVVALTIAGYLEITDDAMRHCAGFGS
jgi:hypothetical protein